MQESYRVAQWLYGLLATDGVLQALVNGRVYKGVAPEGTAFPYIVFTAASTRDVNTVNQIRINVDTLYLVEAIDQSSSDAALSAIADRIDQLLDRGTGMPANYNAVAGITILSSSRDLQVERSEESDTGISYRHLGGRFRIRAQST